MGQERVLISGAVQSLLFYVTRMLRHLSILGSVSARRNACHIAEADKQGGSSWAWDVLLAACGPSDEALSRFARQGETESGVPVHASSAIVIQAPVHQVWRVLSDLGRWPRWQHDVDRVDVSPPIGVGTTFVWTTGGTIIRSQIALFSPDHTIAWTGHASIAKAVHVITLKAVDASHTSVVSTESMDGPFLSLFYSSHDLEDSEHRLLQNLKVAAETPAPH